MNAFVKALTGQAILTNQKDMVICLEFLTQLAPAALWGEAMHVAGLFRHITDLLNNDEVNYLSLLGTKCMCSQSVDPDDSAHRMRVFACEDRPGRQTNILAACIGNSADYQSP